MIENEMDYRGSKSSILNLNLEKIGVKEQRVDGNWCFNLNSPWPRRDLIKHLRYTLMALERGYPIEVPSKRLKRKYCLETRRNITLNPYFVTGALRDRCGR